MSHEDLIEGSFRQENRKFKVLKIGPKQYSWRVQDEVISWAAGKVGGGCFNTLSLNILPPTPRQFCHSREVS